MMRLPRLLALSIVLCSGVVPLILQDRIVADAPETASKVSTITAKTIGPETIAKVDYQSKTALDIQPVHAEENPLFAAAFNRKGVSKPPSRRALRRQMVLNSSQSTTKRKSKRKVATKTTTGLLPIFDQPGIKPEHKRLANQVWHILPAKCRDTLKNFRIDYSGGLGRRGFAGPTTAIFDGTMDAGITNPIELKKERLQIAAVMLHEFGHVVDLNQSTRCLGGTPASGVSVFKDGQTIMYNDDPSVEFYQISWSDSYNQKSSAKPADFVGKYAKSDVFEDFSESLVYFVLHNDVFRARAENNVALAAKYDWFETHLFPGGVDVAVSKTAWNGSIPWDVTKLAYEWKPTTEVAVR